MHPCSGSRARIRHRRPRQAFTCIFHLSYRGVALPGSTYNPPSNQRARPTTSRAPADSYWPRRIDAAANPLPSPPRCILLFYLPTLRRRRRGCMRFPLFCVPFFATLSRRREDLHAKTSAPASSFLPPPVERERSPRSYLCHENATPTIFLLFRRLRPPPLPCTRSSERTAGVGGGKRRLSSSSWLAAFPWLVALGRKNVPWIFDNAWV